MTTSAALVLMTAVTFSGQRGLDEFTIRVLGGTNATPQTAAPIVLTRSYLAATVRAGILLASVHHLAI